MKNLKNDMNKLITNLLIILLYVPLMMINMNCEVSEPDNTSAPITKASTLEELQGKKVVSGIINIAIDTTEIAFPIEFMTVVIDSAFENAKEIRSPFIYELNTSDYKNGLHNVEILVYNKNFANKGSSLIITGIIDIDNSYPFPVILSFGEFDKSTAPVLIWTQTPSRNFTEYIVWRKLSSYYNGPEPWEAIDTIDIKTDTVYTDESLEIVFGQSVYYKVAVVNNLDKEGAESGEISYILGDLGLPLFRSNLVASRTKPEIFYMSDSKAITASVETNSIVRTDPLPASYTNYQYIPDKYGIENYITLIRENKIKIYNADAFTLKKDIDINFGKVDYAVTCPGKQGEIFVKTDSTEISRINTSTGEVIGTFSFSPTFGFWQIISSPDNSRLYVMKASEEGGYISVINVSSAEMNLIKEVKLDEPASFLNMPDNNTLYEEIFSGQYMYDIRIRNASTLEISNTIPFASLDGGASSPVQILVGEENLYISRTGVVFEVDRSTLKATRSWRIYREAYNIRLTYNGEYLYFSSPYLYNNFEDQKIFRIKLK